MKSLFSVLIPIVALVGCAPPDTTLQVPKRSNVVLSATKNQVWPLIISEIGLNYPVQALEKESGLITTQFVNLPVTFNNGNAATWIYPPGGFLATWGGLRVNLRILAVEIEAGKTSLTINCHYEAFESNVQKAWVLAKSNGSLENELITRIEAKLPK